MDITELRSRIDAIDSQIVALYGQRMDTAAQIGAYKKEKGLPVLDTERERELLNKVGDQAGPENENGVRALFSMLMAQSRSRQLMAGRPEGKLEQEIRKTMETTNQLFPSRAMVACQGVEGAYSQIACEKIFQAPSIMYCKNFESVFSAIESGLCRYGILPIENSLAGSVNSVYDQMISHHFYIVRSARIKIDHTLLVKPGVRTEEIREVYRKAYASGLIRFAEAPDEGGFLSAEALAGRDSMEISVFGNPERMLLTARFDNLGKGASGAAIQNMNIVLGLDEKEGLTE